MNLAVPFHGNVVAPNWMVGVVDLKGKAANTVSFDRRDECRIGRNRQLKLLLGVRLEECLQRFSKAHGAATIGHLPGPDHGSYNGLSVLRYDLKLIRLPELGRSLVLA